LELVDINEGRPPMLAVPRRVTLEVCTALAT
jgi:hypothetical protein